MRATLALAVLALLSSPVLAEVQKTAPPEPKDMISLFNGKDLTGWQGDPRLWSVKDGAIRGESTPENPCKSNTFLLYVGDQNKPVEFKDFDLRLSVRIDHGNAGVQYRSKHLVDHKDNKWVVAGYQMEVANSPTAAGFLYHEKGRAGLANVGEKVTIYPDGKKEVTGKLGDRQEIGSHYNRTGWNDYVIICRGNHIQQFVNGYQTIDLVDNDPKGRAMAGILALQIHAGPPMWVDYKDVRIKKLD